MTDALLERLTAPAPASTRSRLVQIPWAPEQDAPAVVYPGQPNSNDPLPRADVVVSTYTAAEGQALADVLSPGLELERWTKITRDSASYESELTYRSPARESRCLGQGALIDIGSIRVLLLRNELHLATDSKALPLRRFWGTVAQETGCELWIDSGTAGGIGPTVVEGDAVVGQNLVFDCTGQFKDESWAKQSFPCTYPTSSIDFSLAERLMATNAGLLRPEASRDPVVHLSDVITCDSFLFDDAEDSFGLEKYDGGDALVEEMDCAVLGLVAQDLGASMPRFTSVRSVSDPQMPKGPSIEAEKSAASQIYLRYGYAAQVSTLCAVWQVITSL